MQIMRVNDVLVLLFHVIIVAAVIEVNTKTNMLKDEQGRTRIFHGVNAVYQPFYTTLF